MEALTIIILSTLLATSLNAAPPTPSSTSSLDHLLEHAVDSPAEDSAADSSASTTSSERDARRLDDVDDARRLLIQASFPIRLSQAETARRQKQTARTRPMTAQEAQNLPDDVTAATSPEHEPEYVYVKIRREPYFQPHGYIVVPIGAPDNPYNPYTFPRNPYPPKGLFSNVGNFFGSMLPIEINIPDIFTSMGNYITRLPVINRWQTHQQTKPRVVYMPPGYVHSAPRFPLRYPARIPARYRADGYEDDDVTDYYGNYLNMKDSERDLDVYMEGRQNDWGYAGGPMGRALFQRPPAQTKFPKQKGGEDGVKRD